MNENAPPRPGRDAVYRLIQWVMLSDVLLGVILAGVGAFIMKEPAFVIVGVGLATIGFALFLFFRMLARRAGPHDRRR